MNVLVPKKNLRFLLNRRICFLYNQTLTNSTGRFVNDTQTTNHLRNTVSFNHEQLVLSEQKALSRLLPVRNFSSSKTSFSSTGTNRDKEDRQVMIFSVVLLSAILTCVILMVIMEKHQDYVILKPENKK